MERKGPPVRKRIRRTGLRILDTVLHLAEYSAYVAVLAGSEWLRRLALHGFASWVAIVIEGVWVVGLVVRLVSDLMAGKLYSDE